MGVVGPRAELGGGLAEGGLLARLPERRRLTLRLAERRSLLGLLPERRLLRLRAERLLRLLGLLTERGLLLRLLAERRRLVPLGLRGLLPERR
ncbi:hypothetical protein GCM10027598_46990 [Amycolatopsis oliviviridis]